MCKAQAARGAADAPSLEVLEARWDGDEAGAGGSLGWQEVPYSFQRAGTGWALRSLPSQAIQ